MVKKKRTRIRKTNTDNWGSRGESVSVAATVLIPSGLCPVIIEEYSRANVVEWVQALTESKPAPHTYKKSVYKYWLRHSFDIFSKEYKDACEIIDEIVPEEVRTQSDITL